MLINLLGLAIVLMIVYLVFLTIQRAAQQYKGNRQTANWRAAHDPEGLLPPPPLPPKTPMTPGKRVFVWVLLAVLIVFEFSLFLFMAWALSSTGL